MIKNHTNVASIGKACAVLELFGPDTPTLRIVDIAQRTGMTRSSAQRIIHTLASCGCVERGGTDGVATLSHRVIHPAHCYLASNPVLAAAMPLMVKLNEDTKLSCDLWIIDGDDAVLIARVPSSMSFMTIAPIGLRVKLAAMPHGRQPWIMRTFHGGDDEPVAVMSLSGPIDPRSNLRFTDMLTQATAQLDEMRLSSRVRTADHEPHPLHIAPLPAAQQDPLHIDAVARGFHLLQFFHPLSPALSLTELANRTGFSIPMVQRITDTFVSLGYIARDPVTRAFHVGTRSLDLFYRFQMTYPLIGSIWPRLLRLREQTGLRLSFCILNHTEIIHLIHIQSRPQEHFRTAYPGRRLPALSTSGGRAIMAFLPDEQCRKIMDDSRLEAVSHMTVTDKPALHAEIEITRQRGYAFTDQQSIRHEVNVAVPIIRHGKPVGAIVISASTHNWSIERLEREVVPLLLAQTEP